ncbi:uncharacterized protein LOC131316667 [Rhododendron vialii]|uniref:uncharacterized protein LOC131316667 n=1 Tax=Rhododendron vialii TaxID=182163 RepID=UPI00265EF501|nr:uncharacterized protein LOC131316667 [Rhododendron vialii]
MSRLRANSSPELLPASLDTNQHVDSSLEGVAATVKLLLKLLQDHKESCAKEQNDSRRMLRVAGMMTILDNVKTRIQTCQSFGKKGEKAELRRCNTDLHRPTNVPRDHKKPTEQIDEKEKLRRELNASLAARKSLECMCSSLGKEKEIMAAELARKVHELSGMEELVSDLKAQNENLLGKVQEYALEHKEKKTCFGGDNNAALEKRNKELTEKLLRSLEGYKSKSRKLKEALEEKATIHATMEEMGVEIGTGLERIRGFKKKMAKGSEQSAEIEEEISELEHMFECFQMKLYKHGQKKVKCVKPKGEISACKPSILA